LRCFTAFLCLSVAVCARAAALPSADATTLEGAVTSDNSQLGSPLEFSSSARLRLAIDSPDSSQAAPEIANPQLASTEPVKVDGKEIPLELQQPKRILGFMPNFRSVSSGSKPHPPGWKYNFTVATRQSTDYSSFVFLGITSLTAEGMNMHPALGKGIGGAWAYSWRGFLDKSDNTYLSAWLLSSALHEDTRFYAMGTGHSIPMRELYVISRQAVARTYGGRQTPNIAGLGAKVLTQIVSRTYYPSSATTFPVLATKFAYSAMRDIAITSIREFYPDAAAHFIRKHREKVARLAQHDNDAAGVPAP
jgi:hypothetical protein